MAFRLSTKQIAFTFSQTEMPKELVLASYRRMFEDTLEDWCVVQEEHKDGGKHIHGYIKLKNKLETRNQNYLDINGEHGHYKGVRGLEGWIEYLLKEDSAPLQSQDWASWLLKSKNHLKRRRNKEMTDMLMEMGPYKMLQLGEIAPSQYKTWKNAYELIIRDKDQEEALQKEDLPTSLPNDWNLTLNFDLDNKRCHFWIYSHSPNMGKTTWLNKLTARYRAAWWNISEVYQNHIPIDTELILIDEFRGNLKITTLNSLCDGTLLIPQKGMAPIRLKNKPLIVIVGNRSPEECYRPENLSYIHARFNIIDLELISTETLSVNIVSREMAAAAAGSGNEKRLTPEEWEAFVAPMDEDLNHDWDKYN